MELWEKKGDLFFCSDFAVADFANYFFWSFVHAMLYQATATNIGTSWKRHIKQECIHRTRYVVKNEHWQAGTTLWNTPETNKGDKLGDLAYGLCALAYLLFETDSSHDDHERGIGW